MDREKLYLQSVVIKKSVPLEEAKKMAHDIIKNSRRKFYRETEDSYRFRNIPKTEFKLDSFVTKKINENLTLIFGKLA